MKRLRFPLALAFLLVLAAACGGGGQKGGAATPGGTGTVGGGTQTAGAGTQTMTVGAIGPASGGAAPWGIAINRAATLFEEDTQKAGGVAIGDKKYLFKHVFYDTKGDVGETATVTNRLVFQDGVKYIIGNAIGATCDAAEAITEPNNVLFTFICWGKTNLGPKKPHSFRSLIGPDEAAPMFYKWVSQQYPNVKTVALVSPNDQSGVDTSAAIKKAAPQFGLRVVADEGYQRGTQEYTSLLTRILEKKPDMIDLSGSATGDGALILKQLHQLGYKGKLAWLSMLDPVPVVKTAGTDATQGLIGIQGWDPKSDLSPQPLRDFATRYEQRFGEPATIAAAAEYAAYEVITQAMAQTGSTDPTAVANAIAKIGTFKTVLGQVTIGGKDTYGIDRQFIYPMVVSEIQNGKSVPLARVEPQ